MPYSHTPDNTRLFYIDTHAGRPMAFVASAWLNSRMCADRVAGIALVSGTTPFPMKTADNP